MRNSKGQFVKGHEVLQGWKEISREVNIGNSRHSTPHTEETKLKISTSRKGVMIGEQNHSWKGDDVSYRNLHRWVERHLGKPNKCKNCGKIGTAHEIHWANKSHKYLRVLFDWIRLCANCHKAYDKKSS